MNAAHIPTPGSAAWTEVCPLDAIWPDTGVAARVGPTSVQAALAVAGLLLMLPPATDS